MDEEPVTVQPEAATAEASSENVPRSRRNLYIAIAAIIVVVAAGIAYYFYDAATQDPQAAAKKEAQSLVASVLKHMVLPEGELPIVATVADPSKLEGQPFFQSAQKGDKVLIFNVWRKAVLYSPEKDRIIDVAPLSVGQPSN